MTTPRTTVTHSPELRPTGQFTTVAQHEVRELLRSPAHVLLWIAFTALLVFSAFTGRERVTAARADLALIEELDQRALDENLERLHAGLAEGATFAERLYADPHWLGLRHAARHALLPELGSGALAAEDDVLAADAVLVTSAALELARGETTTTNPTLVGAGALDPAFVLAWLLPLVVLAFCYGALTEERERGTAVLLFATPVPVGTLLLGKLLPRSVLLGIPAAAIAGAIASTSQDPDALLRATLTAGAVLLFTGVWVAAAAVVNVGRAGSASAALLLAGGWLVATIGVPAAADAAWAALDDGPSAALQVSVEREAKHVAQSERASVLDDFMADHPELSTRADAAGVASYKRAVWATQDRVEELVAPIAEERDRARAERARFMGTAALLSPVTALERVLDEVAGRGAARRARFEDAVRGHHERWRTWFVERTLAGDRMEPNELEDVPRFHWDEESTRAVASHVAAPLGALAVHVLLLALLAAARRSRFRPLERSADAD
jgi:ABC-2 type transport system permease protein